MADGVVGFAFTKISNAGTALPDSAPLGSVAADWACTYDNVTGLMWEVKTSSGRRSSAHSYTWFSIDASNNAGATGIAKGGTFGDAGQCDTEKFAATTNAATLCGHNDWRMPHLKDLESIAHLGVTNPAMMTLGSPILRRCSSGRVRPTPEARPARGACTSRQPLPRRS